MKAESELITGAELVAICTIAVTEAEALVNRVVAEDAAAKTAASPEVATSSTAV